MSGEFGWISRAHKTDPEEETCSVTDISVDDNSRNSGIDTYSDRNSSRGSELSELAIHTLLVETRAKTLTERYIKTLTLIATCYPAKQSLTTQPLI